VLWALQCVTASSLALCGQKSRISRGGCPSLRHEAIHGGTSCTRSTRTLTELSPCFCLPPHQKVMLPTGAAFRWFQ
jgi:hypothetical protein